MTILFQDEFESGDSTAWSSTVGTPICSTTPVHHGGYAITFDASGEYISKTIALQTTCYLRFYFQLSSLPNNGATFSIAVFRKAGVYNFGDFKIFNNAGVYVLRINSLAPNETYTSTVDTQLKVNQWNCVEWKYVRSATLGEWRAYWNGVEVITQTGLDTSDVTGVDTVQVGLIFAGIATTLTVDCVVVSDSYIGPQERTSFFTLKKRRT